MQAAIVFVEYLVIGCVAVLWIRLLGPETDPLPKESGMVVLVFAWLYVLGMLVDLVASSTVGRLKTLIKAQLQDENSFKFVQEYERTTPNVIFSPGAALLHLSEKLGARHDAFSTRDRVARGLVVNLLIVAIAALISDRTLFGYSGWRLAAGAAIGALLALAGWWRAEYSSQLHKYDGLATVLALRDETTAAKRLGGEPGGSGAGD